jgi:RES domain-containing protein
MLVIRRGGEYYRVADPAWTDPLTGRFAREAGRRWNPPGSFPVVYLNADETVARANVARLYAGRPYGPEDFKQGLAPTLVTVRVAEGDYVDIVTDAGCVAAGLPQSYPFDAAGAVVPHEVCQPIGQAAWDAGHPGVACRSAAPGAPANGEELAWFARGRRLRALDVRPFADWF